MISCDTHQLVKESFPKEGLAEFSEVSAQHRANRVDVVPVDQGGEGVATLLELLLVLVDVSMCSTDPEDTLVLHAKVVDILDAALNDQRNLLPGVLEVLVQGAPEDSGEPRCLGLHLL